MDRAPRSSPHRRGAALERKAAKALGGTRVHRRRGESAPDLEPMVLGGERVVVEAKHRRAAPALLVHALEQARRYLPSAVPVVVFQAHGDAPVVALRLADFRKLLGLDATPPPAQLPLMLRGQRG